MSRLPPAPPAGRSVYGPDGVPKTSVDVTHRVRHTAQRAHDAHRDAVAEARSVRGVLALMAGIGIIWFLAHQERRRRV